MGRPTPPPAGVTPLAPGAGQESVWDYPRPPRIEPTSRLLEVEHTGVVVARTTRAVRVLETSHPPTYYLPLEDVRQDLLRAASKRTLCEWKGGAAYYDVVIGDTLVKDAAWHYPGPGPLEGRIAFYASRVEVCRVDGEVVRPQEGGFYGGWITSHVVGPFKGPPGTRFW